MKFLIAWVLLGVVAGSIAAYCFEDRDELTRGEFATGMLMWVLFWPLFLVIAAFTADWWREPMFKRNR